MKGSFLKRIGKEAIEKDILIIPKIFIEALIYANFLCGKTQQ